MSDRPPWYSAAQTIHEDTDELFTTLYKICDEMGYNEETRKAYCDEAYKHFRSLIRDMREEIVSKKDELIKTISRLMEELDILSKELKIEVNHDKLNDVPLFEVKDLLETNAKLLKQTRQQRLKYLEELLQQEAIICEALEAQPVGVDYGNNGIPSSEDLESFKLYLQQQEKEKNRYESIFKEMRRSIIKMMEDITVSPTHEFEILVCNNPENFTYTPNNMHKLRELRDQLQARVNVAKQKAALKREELIDLWRFLEVPEASCEEFLNTYSGHGLAHIYALNEEIKRCKKQRFENLEKYIKKCREKIEDLWEKCRFGEEQRQQFKHFYVQNYTEHLLTLHDLELEKLRQFYNANKKIFDVLNERKKLWEKFQELDQRANDPDRLQNRGGQLLIEEKERKVIQKKLPKIEEQLRVLIQEYENSIGATFTIDGQSYSDFLQQDWEKYYTVKQSIKEARAKSRDRSMKKTPVMSTSRRTPATTSSTLKPCTSMKRKDAKSPLSIPAKRRLVNSEKAQPTVVCTSRVRRSGRVSRRLLGNSKTLNTSNRSSKKVETGDETQNTTASDTQYEQFQEHLAQRDELRSSMLPEEVLKTVRTKSKMRTPVKTPVKPMRKNLSSINTPNKTPKTSRLRDASRSPKLTNTPRLAAVPSQTPIFF